MEVIEIKQTCSAFPSQWEGKLKDGRMFTCHYRWGTLTIDISKEPTSNIYEDMDENIIEILEEELPPCDFGGLSEGRLIQIMKLIGFSFN